MKKHAVTLISCFVFFLFFRARWAFSINILDETCYLEGLHKLVGMSYPSCYLSTHLPGVALQWLPAAFFAKIFSWFGFPFEEALQALIAITSFLSWAGALSILHRIITRHAAPNFLGGFGPLLSALLFLLNVPALDFVTKHALMSHAAELLAVALALYFILEGRFLPAIFFCAWLVTMRLNDLPIFFLLVGRMIDVKKISFDRANRRVFFALAGALLVAGGLAAYVGFIKGHASIRVADVIDGIRWDAFKIIFFTPAESVLLFLPLWALSFALGIRYFSRLSWMSRGAVLWSLFLVLFAAGHRYKWTLDSPNLRFFIGCYFGGLAILMELSKSATPRLKSTIRWTLLFGAAWYTLYVWTNVHTSLFVKLITFQQGVDMYAAYDGSQTSTYLRKLFLEPIGMSPIGFSLYSWGNHLEVFSRFSVFRQYAISGIQLYLLTIYSALGAGITVWLLRPGTRGRKEQ